MTKYPYLISVLSLTVMLAACTTLAPTATPTAAGMPSSGPTGADVPALHRTWQWQKRVILDSGQEEQIDDPSRYTLTFKADGTYEFQADCNSGSGGYVADDRGAIRLQPGPVTLAERSPDSRYQDMLNMIQAVQDYRLEEARRRVGDGLAGGRPGGLLQVAERGKTMDEGPKTKISCDVVVM